LKRYGVWRPLASGAIALAKSGLRPLRAAYQQRRVQIGSNVNIAHDLIVLGQGEVSVGNDVVIGPGVVLRTEKDSRIEVGAGAVIGANSVLEVRQGQMMMFGEHSQIGVRSHIICENGISWGEHSSLGGYSFIGPREGNAHGVLVVGRECHLHQHTFIDLCANVSLGDQVRTGPFCAFYTHNHVPKHGQLVWEQDPLFLPINVESGTWIGHGCSVMPGVVLGHNSTVAAGAVVVKPVEPWSVVGGVPARLIKAGDPEAVSH